MRDSKCSELFEVHYKRLRSVMWDAQESLSGDDMRKLLDKFITMWQNNGKTAKQDYQLGVCCSCGYSGEEETECQAREDKTHCVHWWDV
jgi:hypothetical protein